MAMKIHPGDVGHGHFAHFNIAGVDPSVELEKLGGASSRPKKAEGDRVMISPQAQLKALLEEMTKQKQHIAEQKRALVSRTLEKGGTLDSIKAELDNYDRMIMDIDAQMADMAAREIKEQAEKAQPKRDDGEPKTREQAQSERLADISHASGDLRQAETLHVQKNDADGKARVRESEIALDRGRGESTEGKAASLEDKATELADMEQKSAHLTAQLADKLGDANERLRPGASALPKPQAEQQEADPDKVLRGLNEAHPKLNVKAGGANPGERSDGYPDKLDVMIAPNALKQMTSDPAVAERYEKMLAYAPRYVKWADAMTRAITGQEVKYRQVWIDERGNIGAFNAFGPSDQRLRADEAIRKKGDKAFQEKMEKAWEERLEFEKWIRGEDGDFSVEKMDEMDVNRLLNLALL